MRDRKWSWVGACSTGTSHLRAGLGCDDAGGCIEFQATEGPTLVAIASDGAGSAEFSRIGAGIVTRTFSRCAFDFLSSGGQVSEVNSERASEWLDAIRDRINEAASRENAQPRAFAATLVGCIVQRDCSVVIHVGDGACVYRLHGSGTWEVPSWPSQGEYASTTYFVTDDPQPRATINHIDGDVEEIAVFTDGLERLALDFGSSTAFRPFFESMFGALRGLPAGRQRRLSMDLRTFLDSSAVTERSDDDKTLIMARRSGA